MKVVEWDEPVPGTNSDGIETTCNRRIRMTVEDAIKSERYHMNEMAKRLKKPLGPYTDDQLLENFICNNWSTVKDVPDDNPKSGEGSGAT